MTTIPTLAREAASYFETARRADDSTYVRVRDGAPAWVSDVVFRAHGSGDMLPDDWRYATIRAALDWIADESPQDADEETLLSGDALDEFASSRKGNPAERVAWLASHAFRPSYVDEAVQALGGDTYGVLDAIAEGQYMEAREVWEQVVAALAERAA